MINPSHGQDSRVIFNGLTKSSSLCVERFEDIDAFHATALIGGARSVPLRPKEFSAARATLVLPYCQLVLIRSFARIHDSAFTTSGAFVILPMSSHAEATVNGAELDGRSLIFLRGSTSARSIEPMGNLHAIINFTLPMHERGWPNTEDELSLLKANSNALQRASRTVLDLFRFASQYPTYMCRAEIVRAMQQSLLSALDDVLTVSELSRSNLRTLDRYTRIVSRVDEVFAANPTVAYSCEELAQECRVTVRTLHTAMTAIRGMGTHQYLALCRLWSVRRRLAIGSLGVTIKGCAMANGFWHMGDFGRAYRQTFGESPIETLNKARH